MPAVVRYACFHASNMVLAVQIMNGKTRLEENNKYDVRFVRKANRSILMIFDIS